MFCLAITKHIYFLDHRRLYCNCISQLGKNAMLETFTILQILPKALDGCISLAGFTSTI